MQSGMEIANPPTSRRPALSSATDDAALLPITALIEALSLGRSKVYELLKAGEAPPPDVRLSSRCVRWRASTVRTWLRSMGATTDA